MIRSQLAIALARRYNGEIINGDAIQLYRGLPVATNKVRPADMQGVPHHLLGCIGLDEPPWTVSQFVQAAEGVIAGVRSRGKLPIVVGGTHYYVQSLLFPGLEVSKPGGHFMACREMEEKWPVLAAGNEAMLQELRRVDPSMAARWHPNDGRKIRRSLEIWFETGRKPSEIYAAQQKPDTPQLDVPHMANTLTTDLCKHNSLVFWIHADQAVLDKRIQERVDQMEHDGLLDEILELSAIVHDTKGTKTELDMSKGIWAAIGYKEFQEYLDAIDSCPEQGRLDQLRADAIERVKIATRQYAKRQTRWIRLKLLPAVAAAQALDRFFVLDCTRLETWRDDVEESACCIVGQYLAGQVMPDPRLHAAVASTLLAPFWEHRPVEKARARNCQLCNVTTTTSNDWENHVKSKRHRALLRQRGQHQWTDANTRQSEQVVANEVS